MKINVKLFLIVFTIITFISITSASIYHILAQNLLQTQQSKNLINSANDFIFVYQALIANMEDEFNSKFSKEIGYSTLQKSKYLDFVLSMENESEIDRSSLLVKNGTEIYIENSLLSDFLNYNSNLLIGNTKTGGKTIFFGKQIDSEIINDWSQKIRAEIALVEDNVVTKFTNEKSNLYYLPILSKLTRELKNKNNFELVYEILEDEDFSATHYSQPSKIKNYQPIDFVIFNVSKEAAVFKNTMNWVTLIIVVSGILLAVVFLFLFTTKFRKQIHFISEGVINITSGKMKNRVEIITKDEIGNLAHTFNKMLDEIEKRDITEKEYSELLTIINQNPDLEEMGKAVLKKIVSIINIDAGVFYLYEGSKLFPFASMGISSTNHSLDAESAFYKKARDNKDIIEVNFNEKKPIIRTGIIELEINHLYILPIFYGNEMVGILELASVNKPKIDIKEYLERISNQLAIGLANSKSLRKLKNLVSELQKLNNAYQIQNIEITEKNRELLELHAKLKKGAEALEIQTQKAIESEKVKSQFLANMSHELRTPQNSILGLTELILQDDSINIKTRERLSVVLRNGKKLLNLIENILDYSKLESGYEEIKKSKSYISDLVSEINNFVAPFFFERNCTYSVELPKKYDYEIYTDTKKLEQIIVNLIGNASKFTDNGYVKLILRVENNSLIVTVEDSGKGISEADKKIIFEEFRQADANLNRRFSGTGLGLAICNRYAVLLNAVIKLESEPERGSKFTIIIPDIVKDKSELKKDEGIIVANTKIKSLILSDGKHSLDLIRDYLESHNILVEVKTSSNFVFDDVINSRPDIIIIDVLLEKLNGWSLLVDIKSNEKLSNIPIVIVNMDEEANCGFGISAFEYIATKSNIDNVNTKLKTIEIDLGIEIKNALFVGSSEELFNSENHQIKFINIPREREYLREIINIDPDFILLNLFDTRMNSFDVIDKIKSNLNTKNIPILVFLENSLDEKNISIINNHLLETTLLRQYHPLDILKIIKDRIELIDSTIFEDDQKVIYSNDYYLENNTSREFDQVYKTKILIADDNSDARFTIGEIVTSLGYQADFAINGFECLEKIRKTIPDLLLLDIMMPQMDGFQTIREIRNDNNLKNIQVYALTAYAMLSDKEIIEKNGFNGLITKPVNTVQLKRKLNQIFNEVIDEN